jgi:hypothetical protein
MKGPIKLTPYIAIKRTIARNEEFKSQKKSKADTSVMPGSAAVSAHWDVCSINWDV